MTSYLLKCCFVYFTFCFVNAFAQQAEFRAPFQGCEGERFKTVFINGIGNDKKKTRKSMRRLGRETAAVINTSDEYDIRCFEIDYSYNKSESFLNDIIEAYVQAEDQNDWLGVAGFLLDAANAGVEFASQIQPGTLRKLSIIAAELLINTKDVDLQIEETSQSIIADIEYELALERHVLIVSHSQGNFYANSVYERLAESWDTDKYLSIVAVATPASFVAGRVNEREAYTTNYSDLINRVTNNLDENVESSVCDGNNLIVVPGSVPIPDIVKLYFCHGFIDAYMTEPETKENILRDFFEKVDAFISFSDFTGTFEAERVFNIETALQGLKLNKHAFGSLNDDEYYLGVHEDYNRDTALYYVNTAQDTHSLITDGNGFVPLVTDGNGFVFPGVQSLVKYESNFYFIAQDEVGESQLWTLDSFNRQRARKLNDYSLSLTQPLLPYRLTKLENLLIVDTSVYDGTRNIFIPLYIKNPGSVGTKTFNELKFDDGVDICSGAHLYTQAKDRVYFLAHDCSERPVKTHIWSFSPNDLLPKAVHVPDIDILPKYAGFKSLGSHNGKLYFTNNVLIDGEVRQFLYTTDGVETTQLVEMPLPEGTTVSIVDFLSVKNKLFIGFGSFGEKTVAVTDGTVDGTVFLDRTLTGNVSLQFGYDYGDYVVTLSSNESLDIRQLLIINVDTLELLTVPITGFTSAAFYNGEFYYFLDGQFKRLSKDLVVEDIPWPLTNAPLWLDGRQDGLYALTDSPTGIALFRLRE